MFDYLNYYFKLDNHLVESNFSRDKLYFNTDIFYDYSPILKLPKYIDEFKSTHRSKFWYNIRRSKRLFQEDFGEISFEIYKNKNAFRLLDTVRHIFIERWANTYTSFYWKRKDGFDKFKTTIDYIINNYPDTFQISVLKIKSSDEIIAYSVGFETNNTYYFWMHNVKVKYSLSKYSLGTIFLNNLLFHLIDKGNIKIFDFMLGINDYKLKWAKQRKKIYWRIKTKKNSINLIKHIFKVLFYFLKIKIQKNKFFSNIFKRIFIFFERSKKFNKIFNIIERYVFRM